MIRNTFKLILAASFLLTCLSVNAHADEWSVAVENDDIAALNALLKASHPLPAREDGKQLWRRVAGQGSAAMFTWFVANNFPGIPDSRGVDAWGLAAGSDRTDLLELLKIGQHPIPNKGIMIWRSAVVNKRTTALRWLHANKIPGMNEIGEGGQNIVLFAATYDADTVLQVFFELKTGGFEATDDKDFNIWEIAAATGSTNALEWLCKRFPTLFEPQRALLREIARVNEQPGVVYWIDQKPHRFISSEQENLLMRAIENTVNALKLKPGQIK